MFYSITFEIQLFSKLQFKNIYGKNIRYLTNIFTGLISSKRFTDLKLLLYKILITQWVTDLTYSLKKEHM